jgi:hypothetical protein
MNIRIGHPARILEDFESYSIYAQLEKEVERLGLANLWDRIKKKHRRKGQIRKTYSKLEKRLD